MYSEDISMIGDFISSLDLDIVCLQELTKNYSTIADSGAYLAERLDYQSYYEYGPMVLPDGQQALMGMGIFSRLPLTNPRKLVLQEPAIDYGKINRDERFYLEATITLPTRDIIVGTTHLPFHPTFRTTPTKRRMVSEIIDAIG
jgi:endonuclease/exonuclease/phosphatase family metal-dependent hydrolase